MSVHVAGLSNAALWADEQTMLNGLAVIEQHAALRLDCDLMHPALFPIDHMFRLLIDLISTYAVLADFTLKYIVIQIELCNNVVMSKCKYSNE